eukprot:Amastigsp_a176487_80.p2 type:complete len:290 gc:universal Amastigsp_a176487_80:1145-276(-)
MGACVDRMCVRHQFQRACACPDGTWLRREWVLPRGGFVPLVLVPERGDGAPACALLLKRSHRGRCRGRASLGDPSDERGRARRLAVAVSAGRHPQRCCWSRDHSSAPRLDRKLGVAERRGAWTSSRSPHCGRAHRSRSAPVLRCAADVASATAVGLHGAFLDSAHARLRDLVLSSVDPHRGRVFDSDREPAHRPRVRRHHRGHYWQRARVGSPMRARLPHCRPGGAERFGVRSANCGVVVPLGNGGVHLDVRVCSRSLLGGAAGAQLGVSHYAELDRARSGRGRGHLVR